MATPIPVVLIGGGQRGAGAYASYALREPSEMRIVAIAEPNDQRRTRIAEAHQIPDKRCFQSWEDLLDAPLMGDAALICTPDNLRADPALGALQNGYHVVLETPMAQTPAECLYLAAAAEQARQHLILSYGLRYTAFYRALHDIAMSGRLGQILNYRQERSIALWHTAHQFIRSQHTAPNMMLFLEGVHDLDLILWLVKENIEVVSAMASVREFDLDSAPVEDVPARCVDNCPIEADCPFSALGIYVEKRFRGLPQKGYPHTALANGDEDPETLLQLVENSQWGKCVYHHDIKIIDHQEITLITRSGINVALTINGHSDREARTTEIEGTHGSLRAEFRGVESHIMFHDHNTNKENKINFPMGPYGHGGDHGLMGNLTRTLRGDAESLTLAQHTVNAHLLAFAVEQALKTESAVNFPHFQSTLRQPT